MKILIISFLILGICGANAETPNTEKNITFLMGKLSPTEMEKYEQTYVDNNNVSSYQKNGWLLYAVIGQGSSSRNLMIKKKGETVDKKPEPTHKKIDSATSTYGVTDCLKSVDLVGDDATVLCKGATSNWPVVCYYTVDLVGMDAAILCNRATSGWPRDCYRKTSLVGRDAAILCSGSTSNEQIVCYYVNKTNRPGIVGRDAAMACTGRSLEWIDAVNRMGW